jgi:hypothetical protein
MKKLILLILLSFAFISSANANSNKVINIDGKNFIFPSMNSLVRVDASSIELFNSIESMNNNVGLHLLDAFFLQEDIDAFINGEELTFAKHVQIKTRLNNGNDVPYSVFVDEVEFRKEEALKVKDTLKKSNALLDKQGNFIANTFEVEIDNNLQYISPQPIFIDTETHYGDSWVYINKQTVNGEVIEYGRIVSSMSIFIKNRMLGITFYSNWASTNQIAPQEIAIKNWLESFLELNN